MERGVKNHSLGFQDSFMEGKWRKASEKAEKGGFWRKKRKNITSNSRVFVWSGQNEMQREIQSQKLTLRTSGWVRWSVFFFVLFVWLSLNICDLELEAPTASHLYGKQNRKFIGSSAPFHVGELPLCPAWIQSITAGLWEPLCTLLQSQASRCICNHMQLHNTSVQRGKQ